MKLEIDIIMYVAMLFIQPVTCYVSGIALRMFRFGHEPKRQDLFSWTLHFGGQGRNSVNKKRVNKVILGIAMKIHNPVMC